MNWQKRARKLSRSPADSPDRRGTVLIAALVCLLIVMAMLGTMLQGALRAHRQMRSERDLRQTELLLQAGSDRAAYRIANDANYRGETWTLPAGAIAENREAQVTIEAARPDGQTAWKIKVLAEYPLGGETSIRRSRTFQVPPQKNSE
jgi:type II secretory pathway component PulK